MDLVSLAKKIKIVILLAVMLTASFSYSQDKTGGKVKSGTEKAAEKTLKKETPRKAPGEGFEEKDFGPKVDEDSYGWLLFQVVLILGFLAGGFYMFYRFISRKTGLQVSGQDVVQTLSAVPMGPGKSLYIVDVAGKIFMLGVTDSNINLITEVTDKDEKDRIRLLSSRSAPVQGKNFGEFLTDGLSMVIEKVGDLKNRKKTDKSSEKKFEDYLGDNDIDVDYLKSQKNRLKKMNGNDEE